MSVIVLFGVGALIGLVALTAVVVVTLLTEKPDTEAPYSFAPSSAKDAPSRADAPSSAKGGAVR